MSQAGPFMSIHALLDGRSTLAPVYTEEPILQYSFNFCQVAINHDLLRALRGLCYSTGGTFYNESNSLTNQISPTECLYRETRAVRRTPETKHAIYGPMLF